MPISHKLRCVFVHIPKTGGTSIEHALGMRGRHAREDRRKMIGPIMSDDLKSNGFLSNFLQHLTLGEIRRVAAGGDLDEYLTFTIVRNPWDRMVSAYFRPDGDLLAQARAQGVELEGLSFRDFVEASMAVRHAHLRPQFEYLIDSTGRIMVDMVGRFETLPRSFQRVCRRLGVRRRLPAKYVSTARPSRDHRGHYDTRTWSLVAQRYARDVELFGYEP